MPDDNKYPLKLIPDELLERLDGYCKERKRSKNYIIKECMEKQLPKLTKYVKS